MPERLTRRQFLRLTSAALVETGLAACGIPRTLTPTAVTQETSPPTAKPTIVFQRTPSATELKPPTQEPPSPTPLPTFEPTPTLTTQEQLNQRYGPNAVLGKSSIDPTTLYYAVAEYRPGQAKMLSSILEDYRDDMNIDVAYLIGVQEGGFGLRNNPQDPENVGNVKTGIDYKTLAQGMRAMIEVIMSYPQEHNTHSFETMIYTYAGDFHEDRIEDGHALLSGLREISKLYSKGALTKDKLPHAIHDLRVQLQKEYGNRWL